MSKSLSNILTVFKVAKIVAKVLFILGIVGAVGCLIGLASLITLYAASILLPAEFLDVIGDIDYAYGGCVVGIISCAAMSVWTFFAEKYFDGVIKSGTPFTLEGSKECFRLGLISLITSAAATVTSGIVMGVIAILTFPESVEFNSDISVTLSTGLFFMFLSMIFKHGAELRQTADELAAQKSSADDNRAQ